LVRLYYLRAMPERQGAKSAPRGITRSRQRLECGELAPAFPHVPKRRQAGRTPNAPRTALPLVESRFMESRQSRAVLNFDPLAGLG
jgi:hypothetical protein